MDKLFSTIDVEIVRRSDLSTIETFNEVGNVRTDVIADDRVPNMSMNILGSFFKVPHIRFSTLKDGALPWDGEKIYLSTFRNFYRILEVYTPIFYSSRDLHGISIPFSPPKDNPAAKKLAEALKKQPNANDKYEFQGESRILHAPTKMNYWHIELALINEDGQIIKKNKNQIERLAVGYMVDHILSVKGRPIVNVSKNDINPEYYKK